MDYFPLKGVFHVSGGFHGNVDRRVYREARASLFPSDRLKPPARSAPARGPGAAGHSAPRLWRTPGSIRVEAYLQPQDRWSTKWWFPCGVSLMGGSLSSNSGSGCVFNWLLSRNEKWNDHKKNTKKTSLVLSFQGIPKRFIPKAPA